MRIGVFDSGLGGLSTLVACLRRLPDAEYLFFGDTANAPYGDRSAADVVRWTQAGYDWLVAEGVDAVVLACNTATSAAAVPVRERARVPVIGIEPALKGAVTAHSEGPILLLATTMTAQGGKLAALLERLGAESRRIRTLACPGLMEIIETGGAAADGEAAAWLRRHIVPAVTQAPAAIVLGCTHYCLVPQAMRTVFGHDVPLVDGNDGVARQLHYRLFGDRPEGPPPPLPTIHARVRLHFTDRAAEKRALARALLERQGVILADEKPSPHVLMGAGTPG